MPQFQRKRTYLEARQYTGNNGVELFEWIRTSIPEDYTRRTSDGFYIPLLDNNLFAAPGDWITKDQAGRFAVMSEALFAKYYEPVAEAQ